MKKRNFITGFSAAFVALITLASCGGIRAKDGVVLTINGKQYTAKELYEDQKTPAAAEAKFNAVYKVAVRRYFQEGQEGYVYHDEITRDTKNKVAGAKAEAQSNADKNGTKYATEWEKILSTNGVEDESELYDKFEYDVQKSKFDDIIYDRKFEGTAGEKGQSNYDVLRNGGYLKDKNGNDVVTGEENKLVGYLNNKMPYHMKHILVKISAKDGNDVDGEITADEAEKICEVITQLANGVSFETVASLINDDDTAKKNHGSLGIMSRDTSFVNDFKLGTYLYDAFFSTLTSGSSSVSTKYDSKTAKDLLFKESGTGTAKYYADLVTKLSDPTAISNTEGLQLGRIPYGVIKQLMSDTNDGCKLYKMDLTVDKTKERFNGVEDVKAKYYPRNIIFNKYFNKHNLMIITNTSGPEYTHDTGTAEKYITSDLKKGSEDDSYINNTASDDGLPGFKNAVNDSTTSPATTTELKNEDTLDKFLGSTADGKREKVLCDENGRVILVFRSGNGSSSSNDSTSYQGIHFIVIERSPFVGKEWDSDTPELSNPKYTTLDEYYTQYYPGQTGNDYHPRYDDTSKDYKKTYTSYTLSSEEPSKLKERADTVKSELKKADDNLNTYVYDYLLKNGTIAFNQSSAEAKNLEATIRTWISNTKRGATEKEAKKSWNETWETYYDNLSQRTSYRAYQSGKGLRVAPEILVKAFTGEQGLLKSGTTDYTLKEVFGKEGAYNE